MDNIFVTLTGAFNWYGFLIGSAMVISIVTAYFIATKRGYYKDMVFDIAIVCIPLAIVGARAYYIIFDILGNPNHGHWGFKEILGIGTGGLAGLAIYGGLIGAVIGGIIVHFWKRKKPLQERASFFQMADLAFPLIILSQAIGRWGNFVNQEAFGNAVTNPSLQWFPYAVYIDAQHGWYQATFFYESICNLIGFALLMWLYVGKHKSFDGFITYCYCIFYGIVRFFIEELRSDSLYFAGIKVSRLLSAILVVFGIVMILTHMYRARAAGKKPFIFVDQSKLNNDYLGYEQSILSHPNVYDKSTKEKGFFAKLFAKTEDTPEPAEEEEKHKEDEDAEEKFDEYLGGDFVVGEASADDAGIESDDDRTDETETLSVEE